MRLWRRESPEERKKRKLRKILKAVRRRSAYLAKRPFSDSSDDDLRTGVGGSGW